IRKANTAIAKQMAIMAKMKKSPIETNRLNLIRFILEGSPSDCPRIPRLREIAIAQRYLGWPLASRRNARSRAAVTTRQPLTADNYQACPTIRLADPARIINDNRVELVE